MDFGRKLAKTFRKTNHSRIMNTVLVGLLLVVAVVCDGFSDNFCDPQLCKTCVGDGEPIPRHVACVDPGATRFSRDCPDNVEEVEMTEALQKLLLNLHNKVRSEAASGQLPGFSPCNRMIENTWSSKLAYVAGFNSRSCRFAHDKCRNTVEYPYSGQNIAIISSSGDYINDRDAITEMFQMWAGESVNCSMGIINSYHEHSGGEIGHFTQIINNKSSQLGCSVSKWRGNEGATTYLVCNYGLTNIDTQKIYTLGKAASKCTAGVSATYPSLCNPSECDSLKPFPYGYSVSSSSTSSSSSYSSGSQQISTYSENGGPEQTVVTSESSPTITTSSYQSSGPQVITYESPPQITTYESSSPDGGFQSYSSSSSSCGSSTVGGPPFPFPGFPDFPGFPPRIHGGKGKTTVVTKHLGNGGVVTITRTVTRSSSPARGPRCGADDDGDMETSNFPSIGGLLFK